MAIKIHLQFDNTSATFRPGEVVKGTVFTNATEIKQLNITFHGEGNVLWNETKFGQLAQDAYDLQQGIHITRNKVHPTPSSSSGSAYHHHPRQFATEDGTQTEVDFDSETGDVKRIVLEYKNQEIYMHSSINPLLLNTDECFKEQTIPFTFQLPPNLPSSCELAQGSIKYFADAKLTYKDTLVRIPHDKTIICKEAFTILGYMDLAKAPGVLKPFVIEDGEHFYGFPCCCQRGGEFGIKLCLGRTGYIPGEKISFEMNYKNGTSATIKRVTASIIQTITYISGGGKQMPEVTQLCEVPHNIKIFPGSKGACMGQVPVSGNAIITDFGGCRIMHVRHAFRITSKGSCRREAIVEIPITIGAKPAEKLMGETFKD